MLFVLEKFAVNSDLGKTIDADHSGGFVNA
jgi:hypothetical protein